MMKTTRAKMVAAAFAVSTALVPLAAAAQQQPRPPMPPPAAIDACAGAVEGDGCGFVGRFDDEVLGTCAILGDQLACRPEGGPPPRREDCNSQERGAGF